MAKEKETEGKQINYKVAVFWTLIIAITVLYFVLFVSRAVAMKEIKNYNDIAREKLNLVGDIAIKKSEGPYYVYMYSAKKEGKRLVDTDKTDKAKATDVAPIVFNYFSYVKREGKKKEDVLKIYGYNVKNNADDANLRKLDIKLNELPVLVRVEGDSLETKKDANGISSLLSDK